MTSSDPANSPRSGLSRRDLIKRGAVLGGVMWAAPVIETFDDPAFGWGHRSGSSSCVPPPPKCTQHTHGAGKHHHRHRQTSHTICTWSVAAAACFCCCHGDIHACISCPAYVGKNGSAKAMLEASCHAAKAQCVTSPGPCPK